VKNFPHILPVKWSADDSKEEEVVKHRDADTFGAEMMASEEIKKEDDEEIENGKMSIPLHEVEEEEEDLDKTDLGGIDSEELELHKHPSISPAAT